MKEVITVRFGPRKLYHPLVRRYINALLKAGYTIKVIR